MNRTQLKHLALQVRNKDGGKYRDKSLCQECIMKLAPITSPEDKMDFEILWHEWITEELVRRGTCFLCTYERELMTLPATQ